MHMCTRTVYIHLTVLEFEHFNRHEELDHSVLVSYRLFVV